MCTWPYDGQKVKTSGSCLLSVISCMLRCASQGTTATNCITDVFFLAPTYAQDHVSTMRGLPMHSAAVCSKKLLILGFTALGVSAFFHKRFALAFSDLFVCSCHGGRLFGGRTHFVFTFAPLVREVFDVHNDEVPPNPRLIFRTQPFVLLLEMIRRHNKSALPHKDLVRMLHRRRDSKRHGCVWTLDETLHL